MSVFLYELKKLLMLFKADPKSIAAGVIAPTIILIVFAFTFGNFVSLKLAVVNDDQGEHGTQLIDAVFRQVSPLGDNPYFAEVEVANEKDAFSLYDKGEVNGILVINNDFSQKVDAGEKASIDYHFNNYNTDMAKNLRLYLKEGILDYYRSSAKDLDIQVEEVHVVSDQFDWFAIIAVGVFMLSFLMGSMFNFLYLFNKERESKTLCEYRLSPKGVLGSFFARLLVALFAGVIAASINGILIFLLTGVNLALCIPALFAPLMCLGITFVSFAAIISLTIESFSGAAVLSMVTAVVIWFLSGATTSVKYATGFLLSLALVLPSSYGLSQIRAAAFGVEQSVGGMLGIEKGWFMMVTYMIILSIVAIVLYQKRLTRSVN